MVGHLRSPTPPKSYLRRWTTTLRFGELDPRTIQRPRQLVVEGHDCRAFFEAALKMLKIDDIQVQNFGGTTELQAFLPALARLSDFHRVTSVGVVRDADSNPDGAFQSACAAMRKVGWPLPGRPEEVAPGQPAVAVLLLPGHGQEGALEELLLSTVGSDPDLQCVRELLSCIASPVPERLIGKALAHGFLATRDRPGLLFGPATEKGYFPLDGGELTHVRQFLTTLP